MKTYNLGKTFHPINLRNLAKPAALCMIAFFVISILSAVSLSTVHAATSQSFGDNNIQANSNTAGYGQINLCSFQSSTTGTLNSLTLYCKQYSGSPMTSAVVYSDNNGAPGSLLGQGTSTSVPGSFGWLQLSGLSISVTSGTYYWLGFWVSGSGNTISYADNHASSTNEMAYQFSQYNSPPASFGPNGYATWMASIYATVTTSTTTQTPTGQSFGDTNIEANSNTAGYGQINLCSFQSPTTGTLNSLTLYCKQYSGSPMTSAVVYSDNNGAPGSLLGQGTSTPVPGSFGWLQLSGLSISVTSGTYYWLGFWVSGSGNTISYADNHASSTNEMAYQFSQYNSPPASFGPNGYATWMTSIYATVTTSTNTPPPSPAPTPVPTPQSPLAPSGNSLISINDGNWYTDEQWLQCPALNVALDTTNTYGGSPSWAITLNSVNIGADNGGMSVAPGDEIVFSVWIKTSAATLSADIGNPQAGGRIGISVYGANGGIVDVATPDGTGISSNSYNTYVPFGTSTWTQVTMSFTVAYSYQSSGTYGAYPAGQSVTPTYIIPWLGIWSDTQGSNEHGTAWFADTQLTVT